MTLPLPNDRNMLHYAQEAVFVIVLLAITLIAARFAGRVVRGRAGGNGRVLSASLLGSIVQALVVTIGLLIILESFGIAIEPLLTALGIGGLAVALALQPTLANLFAGIQLVASRSLRPGDFISVTGFEGYVEDVGWRTTRIRDVTNNIVIMPNQTLATSPFVNYRLGTRALAVEIPFVVRVGADPETVEHAAIDAGHEAMKRLGVSEDGAGPSVRFEQMNPDGTLQAHLVMYVPESLDANKARNEALKCLVKELPSVA